MNQAAARTQIELEIETRAAGRERAVQMMDKREREGHADTNPYAAAIFRRWLLPLAEVLEAEVQTLGKPGRRAAHVALLKPLDARAVAYIAVRATLVQLLKGDNNTRSLARLIGKDVYDELVLATFEHIKPDLFWQISHDLDRKRSKSTRHRVSAMQGSIRNAEVEVPVWQTADREQVGMFLIEQLRLLGMVEVGRKIIKMGKKMTTEFDVTLSDAAASVVDKIRHTVELTMPFSLPFIEPPKPWTSLNEGGYHTTAMRRLMPYCVNMTRAGSVAVIEAVQEAPMPSVFKAINALQAVRWQINGDLLRAVTELAKRGIDMDEIITHAEIPKPEAPEWLVPELTKEQMEPQQLDEFTRWKRQVAEWHTQRKLRGTKWGRFYTATRTANKFAQYPAIYFLYQADFRGRLYAQSNGVSPQGSDLQKALLRFADGKPLDTPKAVEWFKINGANRYGIDKVTFEERIKWVEENDQFIIEWGTDPVAHTGWSTADSPLQFLAWAIEYAQWRAAPSTFTSRIPVGLDGSCNGLQHFSAMLRDSVGGRATNLVPGVKPNDIYQQVADVVGLKLADLKQDQVTERDWSFCQRWIAHGMNRTIVKRSVMTLPYGSTRFSCADFIHKDYLQQGKADEFEKSEYPFASNFLSHLVWDAIGQVVIAASEAMSWLQKCANTLIKSGQPQIGWVAPSGFHVVQHYNEIELTHVRSLLLGGVRIRVGMEGDDPSANRHKNGIAPNFVHSMDASHLTMTVCDCEDEGISSLAMIHDDYGTHAADTQRLYELIRENFVRMYETFNPLRDFSNSYSGLPALPKSGDLDLRQVLTSKFFFA
jgi:DNA-directed RNA polymerase